MPGRRKKVQPRKRKLGAGFEPWPIPDPEPPVHVLVTIHYDTDLTWWQALKFRVAGGAHWTDHMNEIVERQVKEEFGDFSRTGKT